MTFFVSSRRDHADGLHRPDELVDALGGEQVLLDLVGDDAEAGFLDGEPRQRLGLRPDGRRHRVDDAIDLFLREFGEDGARPFGALGQPPRFLGGSEVAVGQGRRRRHARAGGRYAFGGWRAGFGKDAFDVGVRARNDVNGDELADAPRGGSAGVGRGLDRADIAAREHRHIARADVLLADEDDVGGLDHRIGGFNGADEAARFNHAEGVCVMKSQVAKAPQG